MDDKDLALAAFLDIEGAFDNTPFESINSAVRNRGLEDTLCRWIDTMLRNRTVTATLSGETSRCKVGRGCPQGGVLSPLLWGLVVDGALEGLNRKGFYTQGYADDLVVLIVGKHNIIVSELMKEALKWIDDWCKGQALSVNPDKTVVVPFTRRRNLTGLSEPIIGERGITFSREVKYLGVILDNKLTWNAHLEKVVSKAKQTLCVCRRLIGKTWGLKPKMSHWLYTSIVRPRILYGAVVWWQKTQQTTAKEKLNRIQRLACLGITGAMASTPTAALEVMLNLPPLHIVVEREARLAAYRLRNNNDWRGGSHSRIKDTSMSEPILGMVSDKMVPKFHFHKPFETRIEDQSSGRKGLIPWKGGA
jgi:Reverse transcriptase (RNA-dependent DNA polymerase).